MHSAFIKVLSATLIVIAAIYFFWPPILWLLLLIFPFVLLGAYDLLQKKHTIRRNFPLFGRGRCVMEEIRPYLVPDCLLGDSIPSNFTLIMQEASSDTFSPHNCLTYIDNEYKEIELTTKMDTNEYTKTTLGAT